jgi:hypothetical protein
MNYTISVLNIIGPVTLCSVALILIYDAWKMLFKGEFIFFPPMRVGYFLVRSISGKDEANRRKNIQMSSEKIRRNGYYALIGGSILLIGGLYLLIETITIVIS